MRIATLASSFLTTVLILGWFGATPGVAREFRIETDVFVGKGKEPVSETLTIFSDGVVYDFLLTGVEEITLFDRDRNRLVLIDTQRKVKTVLTMDDIVTFVAKMKAQLADKQEGFLVSGSGDAVIEDDGWLKLANGRVAYRAKCVKPKEKATALEYQEFADWYARLNAMRGNLPPFLRIHLNSEIAKRGLIPKTIERTIHAQGALSNKKQVVRSRHLANWRLSKTDRKRIDRAGTYLTTFPSVPFREYIRLPVAAGNNAANRN
ncbi:MAG: hypothetical protein ACQESR_05860 [Planctomycetota bacterium]